MRIGIDFDNTIIDTRSKIVRLIERDHMFSTLEEYYMIPWEETIPFWITYQKELVQHADLFPYAKEIMESLKKEGHQLIGITARDNTLIPNNIELTLEFVRKHQLPFDEICFGCYPKSKKCMEKQIDVMLDDDKFICEDLRSNGILAIIHTTEENKDVEGLRFDSWKEIPNLIEEIERNEKNGRGKCYTYRKHKR